MSQTSKVTSLPLICGCAHHTHLSNLPSRYKQLYRKSLLNTFLLSQRGLMHALPNPDGTQILLMPRGVAVGLEGVGDGPTYSSISTNSGAKIVLSAKKAFLSSQVHLTVSSDISVSLKLSIMEAANKILTPRQMQ